MGAFFPVSGHGLSPPVAYTVMRSLPIMSFQP